MNLSDLNNFDINNIGTAPLFFKLIIIVILAVGIVGLGYYFDTKNQLVRYEKSQAKETELRRTFEIKVAKAANLEEYKDQLEEMRRTFGTLLRQLPSETEIPALIVDISQTALSSGLEVKLFKPGDEVTREFYAEKPIQLTLQGDYHQFGMFASEVAALPRIVTMHNINLSPSKEGQQMTMNALAKTYRYLSDSEEE
ncbi:MAG: type 4a pilus biogenesis protein PilO [Pseudomonadota bacterium]